MCGCERQTQLCSIGSMAETGAAVEEFDRTQVTLYGRRCCSAAMPVCNFYRKNDGAVWPGITRDVVDSSVYRRKCRVVVNQQRKRVVSVRKSGGGIPSGSAGFELMAVSILISYGIRRQILQDSDLLKCRTSARARNG